jgi:hypothetical protein
LGGSCRIVYDPAMSLIHRRSRLLSVAPSLTLAEDWLRATTNDVWVVLSLFSYRRQVHVDARTRRITVRERRFWRTRETRVDVDAVAHIEYGFASLGTSFFGTYSSGRATLQSADTVERFHVGLLLKDGRRLPLFSFVGDGERMNGLLGVLLGDSIVDFSGEQEEDSYAFVKALQDLTGLQLGPALPGGVEHRGPKCPSCGHANVPRARCLYCGAALASS